MTNKTLRQPRRDQNIALDCYQRWLRGETEAEVGQSYGWPLQEDDCRRFRCKTAHRYIEYGRQIHKMKGKLREAAFDIKYVVPVRVKRRRRSKA